MEVLLLDDPRRFAELGARWLAADPLSTNVIGTRLDDVLGGLRTPGDADVWIVAAENERVVGVAMHTPPRHLFLPRLPGGLAAQIASGVVDARRRVAGVEGERDAVAEFAGSWCARTGGRSELLVAMRVYQLRTVTAAIPTPGAARRGGPEDLSLVARWLDSFGREATPRRPGDSATVVAERRLAAGQLWLWCDRGEAVALAGHSATVAGVARVGPVYTPPEQRHRGYGAAVTAAATQAALDAGATHTMLYADLANPTSNSIYRAIGYVADHDAEDRRLSLR